MRISYVPEDAEFWIKYYESSLNNGQYQIGGDLPGFKAFQPYHRGGGIGNFFKSLFRYALPLLKTVGKEALVTSSKIASDVAEGRDFKDSFASHSKTAAGSLLKQAGESLSVQKGKGRNKRSRKPHKRRFKRRRKIDFDSFKTSLHPRVVGSDIFSAG